MVVTEMTSTSIQERKVEIVRRWGGSTSDAILGSDCSIFQTPSCQGLIGYRRAKNCVIVLGDPVCPSNELPTLVNAFHTFCKEKGWEIVYIVASKQFSEWAKQNNFIQARVEFGDELVLNPLLEDPRKQTGTHASLVRRKVRRALKQNITVKEYILPDLKIEKSLLDIGLAWLSARQGPQIHISNVHLFDNRMGKRWFYAEQNGQILGVVVINQLQSHQGWLLNHLMTLPGAPPGIPEILVIQVLETLCNENCSYLTFGTAVKTKLGGIEGLGSFSTWASRQIFHWANKFFQLDRRKDFWGKFEPRHMPLYLLFTRKQISLSEIKALMAALNVKFSN